MRGFLHPDLVCRYWLCRLVGHQGCWWTPASDWMLCGRSGGRVEVKR